jgi:hypothetical protein
MGAITDAISYWPPMVQSALSVSRAQGMINERKKI